MFRLFEENTADAVWQKIADYFRKTPLSVQESRGGPAQELLHAAISIKNPREKWVLSRKPVLNLAFSLAEIIWLTRGRNDAAFLNFFNRQLPKFAGQTDIYHGAYGHRLRKSMGFDQLESAYTAFRANPRTRQVVLQIWDANLDLPDQTGAAKSADIPCNTSSILKINNNSLEWLQIMRSNDIFRGLPYNIVQFTALQEILSGWLEIKMGEYHHISDSLHLYSNCADNIQKSYPIQTLNFSNPDSLAFPKDISDRSFLQLEEFITEIIEGRASQSDLVSLKNCDELPEAFRNMAIILASEALRRNRHRDQCEHLLEQCSNPIYTFLYSEWLNRIDHERVK